MLQHFGADDDVVRAGVLRQRELVNALEPHARETSKPRAAVEHLLIVEICADRHGWCLARFVQQRDQRPIAATVVDHPFAAEWSQEFERGAKSPLVTERDEAI